jgi:hypothetical protein
MTEETLNLEDLVKDQALKFNAQALELEKQLGQANQELTNLVTGINQLDGAIIALQDIEGESSEDKRKDFEEKRDQARDRFEQVQGVFSNTRSRLTFTQGALQSVLFLAQQAGIQIQTEQEPQTSEEVSKEEVEAPATA